MKNNYVHHFVITLKRKAALLALIFTLPFTFTLRASAPTIQASNLAIGGKTCKSIQVTFTRGNGSRAFVTCRPVANSKVNPTDGTNYGANTYFGSGHDLGNDNFVIAYTPDSVVTINGLQQKMQYTVEIFEWDSATKTYLTSISASISESTHFLEVSPEAFRLNGDSCAKSTYTFFRANAKSSFPIIHYIWSWNFLTDSSDVDTLIWKVGKGGIQQYNVRIVPSMGCQDMFSGSDLLMLIPTPKIKPVLDPPGPCLPNNKVQCYDQTTLDLVPKCAYIRVWNFGGDDIATFPSPFRSFEIPTYIRIVYTAETLFDGRATGCKDSMIFAKIGGPGFKFPTDLCVKPGDSLKVVAPIAASKYTWHNQDTAAFIWVKSSGKITLKVKDSLGCEFTNSETVETCAPSGINTVNGKSQSLRITTTTSEIQWNNVSSDNISVSVFTSDGRKILDASVAAGQQKRTAIRPGTYVIGNSTLGYQWYLVP